MDLDTYTETFLLLCYKAGLSRLDLDDMTIGMCMDFIEEYLDMQNPNEQKQARKGTQSDFDSF